MSNSKAKKHKSMKKVKKSKNNKSVRVILSKTEIQLNDFSDTVVSSDYPEFKFRKIKQSAKLAEIPTTDSLKLD